MSLIVVKFGGTSVADLTRIRASARKVAAEVKRGNRVAVVVSAMAGETNRLVDLCQDFIAENDSFEKDVIVSSGEQVSAGMFALALRELGLKGRSFQAWQAGIEGAGVTGKARITDMDTDLIASLMQDDVVPVFTGFQAITQDKRIITLGRGGSDTSAVAIAAALSADRCDIYTDVDGMYTTDPRIVPEARKIKKISYAGMLELAALGAKVLQTRSVLLAMKENVPLQILSSMDEQIGSDLPGSLLIKENNMEGEEIYGIASKAGEAKITVVGVLDTPGVAAKVIAPLVKADIPVDMIVQNVSLDGENTDMTFTVAESDLEAAIVALESSTELSSKKIKAATGLARVSVVGVGVASHAHVAETMFRTISGTGANIHAITTSEIRISVLIDEDKMKDAVQALHKAFELDQ